MRNNKQTRTSQSIVQISTDLKNHSNLTSSKKQKLPKKSVLLQDTLNTQLQNIRKTIATAYQEAKVEVFDSNDYFYQQKKFDMPYKKIIDLSKVGHNSFLQSPPQKAQSQLSSNQQSNLKSAQVITSRKMQIGGSNIFDSDINIFQSSDQLINASDFVGNSFQQQRKINNTAQTFIGFIDQKSSCTSLVDGPREWQKTPPKLKKYKRVQQSQSPLRTTPSRVRTEKHSPKKQLSKKKTTQLQKSAEKINKNQIKGIFFGGEIIEQLNVINDDISDVMPQSKRIYAEKIQNLNYIKQQKSFNQMNQISIMDQKKSPQFITEQKEINSTQKRDAFKPTYQNSKKSNRNEKSPNLQKDISKSSFQISPAKGESERIALKIFDEIFYESFEEALKEKQLTFEGKIFITQNQFQNALNSKVGDSDEYDHLIKLCDSKIITRAQLLQSLINDINNLSVDQQQLFTHHHTSYAETISDKPILNIVKQPSVKQLSAIQSNLKLNKQNSTIDLFLNTIKESNQRDYNNLTSQRKQTKNPYDLNQSSVSNIGLQEKASENLKLVMEYIYNQKLKDFVSNEQKLYDLFAVLNDTVKNVCIQIQQVESKSQQIESKQQQLQEKQLNERETETQCIIGNLQHEIDRLLYYENNYHVQQVRLNQVQVCNHKLEDENENLIEMNRQLLQDIDNIKKHQQSQQIKQNKDQLELQQAHVQILSLKAQLLNSFQPVDIQLNSTKSFKTLQVNLTPFSFEQQKEQTIGSSIQQIRITQEDYCSALQNNNETIKIEEIQFQLNRTVDDQVFVLPTDRESENSPSKTYIQDQDYLSFGQNKEQLIEQEEISILSKLSDCPSSPIFSQIKEYILTFSQPQRYNLKFKNQEFQQIIYQLNHKCKEQQFLIDDQVQTIFLLQAECLDWQNQLDLTQKDLQEFKNQLINENKQVVTLMAEKQRIINANRILEQKIFQEVSYRKAMASQLEHTQSFINEDAQSVKSGKSFISGLSKCSYRYKSKVANRIANSKITSGPLEGIQEYSPTSHDSNQLIDLSQVSQPFLSKIQSDDQSNQMINDLSQTSQDPRFNQLQNSNIYGNQNQLINDLSQMSQDPRFNQLQNSNIYGNQNQLINNLSQVSQDPYFNKLQNSNLYGNQTQDQSSILEVNNFQNNENISYSCSVQMQPNSEWESNFNKQVILNDSKLDESLNSLTYSFFIKQIPEVKTGTMVPKHNQSYFMALQQQNPYDQIGPLGLTSVSKDSSLLRQIRKGRRSKDSSIIFTDQSGKSGKQSGGTRVQIIADFDSEYLKPAEFLGDEQNSIDAVGENDVQQLNENIKKSEAGETIDKSQTCSKFDKLQIYIHQNYSGDPETVFSDNAFIYLDQKLIPAKFIMIASKVFIIDQNGKEILPSFDFLSSVFKMIYSEVYEKFFSLKVKEIQKMKSDHIIFVIEDRDLMAEFIIQIAEIHGGDINFEMNEDFSILLKDLTPTWFSFSDINKILRNQNKQKDFISQLQMSGIVSLKENKQSNIFKQLFIKDRWTIKYLVLKDLRLYIYSVDPNQIALITKNPVQQTFTKPEQVIVLQNQFGIEQKRNHDGKSFVIQVNDGDKNKLLFSVGSEELLNEWTKSFNQAQLLLSNAHQRTQQIQN